MILVFYLALLLFETRYEVQQTLLLLFLFYEKGKKMTSSNSETKYPLFIQKKNVVVSIGWTNESDFILTHLNPLDRMSGLKSCTAGGLTPVNRVRLGPSIAALTKLKCISSFYTNMIIISITFIYH